MAVLPATLAPLPRRPQLRELASLYDAGHLRPLIDRTYPFDQTLEALAYLEQGRAKGKVVVTLDR